MNLPQLIEWGWDNDVRNKNFQSEGGAIVYFDYEGNLTCARGFVPQDFFTVEVEEEITEDTVIPKLMTTFRKIYLKNGTGYQRVRIDENYSIKLMLNKAEAHSEPVETLHIVNDDGTHTLVWRNGKMVE